MRWILHGIAVTVAIVTLAVLTPSIRTGEISVLGGMIRLVIALFAAYALLIVAVGALSGTQPSKWPSIAKQLFRGHSEP